MRVGWWKSIYQGIFGPIRLLVLFYLQPAKWQQFVTAIKPSASAHVTLLQLPITALKPAQRHVLLSNIIIKPILLVTAVAIVLYPQLSIGGLVLAFALAALIGFMFGSMISMASSLLVTSLATAVLAIFLGNPTNLSIHLLLQPYFGLLFGLCTVAATSVLISATPTTQPYRRLRRAGSVTVGLLVSSGMLAVAVGVTSLIVTNWELGQIQSGHTAFFIGFIPLLIFVLAVAVRNRSWQRGLLGGSGIGIAIMLLSISFLQYAGLEQDIEGENLRGLIVVVVTTTYLLTLTLPYVFAERIGGIWAARVAGSLGSLAVHPAFDAIFNLYEMSQNLAIHLLLVLLGLTSHWWRPILFYPVQLSISLLLPRLAEKRPASAITLFQRQPVFWDAFQYLPLIGLRDHMILLAETYPLELEQALTEVANSRQQPQARLAQIELDGRFLESRTTPEAIGLAHERLSSSLPTDAMGALLRSFRRISLDVGAALGQRSLYNQRLALAAVGDRLAGLVRELTRARTAEAQRFRSVALAWQTCLIQRIEQVVVETAVNQLINDPYIIGIPLTARQEIFVGRQAISQRIERFLLERRTPPLLLYGQRRMGKTSLLNNLGRLLPQHFIPLFVDLQGPVSFASDHAGLLFNIARGMQRSAFEQREIRLPALERQAIEADPFTTFDVWLDQVEALILVNEQSHILLLLDEFESLDEALQSGQFQERFVLGMLRHLIQHRQRFKLLLAGSHTLDEFKRWSGYLINAEVLHLGCLDRAEAERLIETPIPNFNLSYPTIVTDHIFALTGGHPFLLQLLCSEIIAIKNQQPSSQRLLVTKQDVQAAIPAALQRGALFFADIERNQLTEAETLMLRRLASAPKEVLPHNLNGQSAVVRKLALRELISVTSNSYSFQNELIRRWFNQEKVFPSN